MQNSETTPLSYITHKNQLQTDWKLKFKTCHCKIPRRKRKIFDISLGNEFFGFDVKSKDNKIKNK